MVFANERVGRKLPFVPSFRTSLALCRFFCSGMHSFVLGVVFWGGVGRGWDE